LLERHVAIVVAMDQQHGRPQFPAFVGPRKIRYRKTKGGLTVSNGGIQST